MFIPEVSANSSILNSTYDLPSDRTIITVPQFPEQKKTLLTPPCKMFFPEFEVDLIFDDNAILLSSPDSCRLNGATINMFVMLGSYETFLNYNCWSARRIEPDELQQIPETESVSLVMEKVLLKQREENGHVVAWHDSEPCRITVTKSRIAEYLRTPSVALFYAIYYYLKGTYTQEYFLIEFYKCLEVIKREFLNEKIMKERLSVHGFDYSCFKKLNRCANDILNPLSIGRHAPDIRSTVHQIDTKWLFSDPKGRQVFDLGQMVCRTTIEAYKNYLLTEKERR